MCAQVNSPFRPGEHESVKGLARETANKSQLSPPYARGVKSLDSVFVALDMGDKEMVVSLDRTQQIVHM